MLCELDKHVTDKELQHTDDFMFCAPPFHFCFVLEPKLSTCNIAYNYIWSYLSEFVLDHIESRSNGLVHILCFARENIAYIKLIWWPSEWVIGFLLSGRKFSDISWREQVNLQCDNDDRCPLFTMPTRLFRFV